MTKSELILREELHLYIDSIGEDKIQAIYKILQKEIEATKSSQFLLTDDELIGLDLQKDKYIQGQSKQYSWKEVESQLLEVLRK